LNKRGRVHSIKSLRRAPAKSNPAQLNGCGVNLVTNLLRPIQAFRLIYLPLVMVYFAYGALGIIDVTRDMWIKESLTLSPAELVEISVWLGCPGP